MRIGLKLLFQHNMAFHSARAVDGKSHCLNDFSAEQIKVVVEYFFCKDILIRFYELGCSAQDSWNGNLCQNGD